MTKDFAQELSKHIIDTLRLFVSAVEPSIFSNRDSNLYFKCQVNGLDNLDRSARYILSDMTKESCEPLNYLAKLCCTTALTKVEFGQLDCLYSPDSVCNLKQYFQTLVASNSAANDPSISLRLQASAKFWSCASLSSNDKDAQPTYWKQLPKSLQITTSKFELPYYMPPLTSLWLKSNSNATLFYFNAGSDNQSCSNSFLSNDKFGAKEYIGLHSQLFNLKDLARIQTNPNFFFSEKENLKHYDFETIKDFGEAIKNAFKMDFFPISKSKSKNYKTISNLIAQHYEFTKFEDDNENDVAKKQLEELISFDLNMQLVTLNEQNFPPSEKKDSQLLQDLIDGLTTLML
jgi:hypothetical protein